MLMRRKYCPDAPLRYPREKKVLDMGVIRRYLLLSSPEQNEIADCIHRTAKEVLGVVKRIDSMLFQLF